MHTRSDHDADHLEGTRSTFGTVQRFIFVSRKSRLTIFNP
jgi:hypothetical protein